MVLSLNPKQGFHDQKLELPCGKCLNCRINRTREWGIRAHHESKMHPSDQNHFVLLTYDDNNLPKNKNIEKIDVKKFLDRIRAHCAWKGLKSPRTFGCAEYGKKGTLRPHYHINIFGLQLDDLSYLKNLKKNKLYTSNFLTEKWQKGAVTISPFSHLTAQYTAKYIVKAFWPDDSTGSVEPQEGYAGETSPDLPPEGRIATSTHPGLGASFLDRYAHDIVNLGAIEIDGALAPIPTYYKKRLQKKFPELYKKLLQNNYDMITRLARDRDKTVPTWAALAANTADGIRISEVANINQLRKLQNET